MRSAAVSQRTLTDAHEICGICLRCLKSFAWARAREGRDVQRFALEGTAAHHKGMSGFSEGSAIKAWRTLGQYFG